MNSSVQLIQRDFQYGSIFKCNLKKDISSTYIKRKTDIYCIICYHFCCSYKFDNSMDVVIQQSEPSCSCRNHLNNERMKLQISNFIIDISKLQKNRRSIQFLRKNSLLDQIFRNYVVKTLFPVQQDLIEADMIRFSALKGEVYHWEEMEIQQISKKINLLKFLKLEFKPLARLENLFKQYCQEVLKKPFSQPEQKNYDAVIALQTTAMNLLGHTTFRQLIYDLEKLDYQTLGSINFIARVRIRERNLKKISESLRLNWVENIKKWIDVYIMEDNKNWVRSFQGTIHKTFYYPIKFARDLVVYGLIKNQEELKEIKDLLYSKINVFLSIEDNVASMNEKQLKAVDPHYIKQTVGCLRQIREFYIQIIYQLFFLQNDFEFLRAIVSNTSEIKKLKTYESEFSRKTLEICIKYALKPIIIQGEDLIYDPQHPKIIDLIRKFLPIINNTEDQYLQSLWLTKNKDLMHYRLIPKFQEDNKFKSLCKFAAEINDLMESYFKHKHNSYIYEQQELIDRFTSKIEQVIYLFNIQSKITLMENQRYNFIVPNLDIKHQIYKQQLIILQSNLLQKIIIFSNLFLVTTQFKVQKALEKLFILYKFTYFKNNINIAGFLQKSAFQKISNNFSDQLFDLLYFGFTNNWIIFSNKGLLNYIAVFWHSQLQKSTKQFSDKQLQQYYIKLKKILIFVRKWNNIQHEKLLKYLPSTDIIIIQQLLKVLDTDFLNIKDIEILFKYEEGHKLSIKQEFQFYYLQTIIFFTEKRYLYDTYDKIRNIFTIQFISSMVMKKIAQNKRAKSILLSIIEFFYIDVKNNLLNNRRQINSTEIAAKDPVYSDLVTSEQPLNIIIDILNFELKEFLEIIQVNINPELKQYFYNSIISPLLRLLNYFGMIQELQSWMISRYSNNIKQLLTNIVTMFSKKEVILKISELPEQNYDLSKITELLNNDAIFDKKIDEFQQIYVLLSNYIRNLFKEVIILEKYNSFLESQNKQSPQNKLLKSKFKRQYLYSNKLDIRVIQIKSSLIKYKNVNAKKQQQNSFIFKLQNSYQDLKIALTSTETKENYYLYQMLSTNQEDKLLIQYLCRHIIHQLRAPMIFKERNLFYSIIECLCNILFVAPINIKNMLYEYSQFDKPENQNWLINIWKEMISSNLFIRIKSNKDAVWIDEYLRFWILSKFMHFLIELNNKNWKTLFLNTKFQDDSCSIYIRFVSLIERMSEQMEWHYNYLQDNLDEFKNKHSQYILKPGCAILDLYNQLIRGPFDPIKQNVYTYLLLQINGTLKRYMKNYNSWLYEYKLKAVEFLLCQIEGQNSKITKFIIENYSITNLNTIMINSIKQLYCEYIAEKQGRVLPYTNINQYTLKQEDFMNLYKSYATDRTFANHNLLNLAFKIYVYMGSIKKVSIKYRLFLQQRIQKAVYQKGIIALSQQEILTYRFLYKISSSIQFLWQQKKQVLAFKIPGKCIYLTEETKKTFLQNVNRDTPQDKINGLINQFKYFKIEMNYYQSKFAENFEIFTDIIPNLEYIQYLIYILAMVINGFLISDLNMMNSDLIINLPHYFLYISIGYIIVFLSIITWFIRIFSSFNLLYRIQKQRKEDLLPKDQNINIFQKILIILKILFFTPDSFVLIFHFTVTLIAINITAVCFSLLLLMIIVRIQTLKYIIKAVWLHLDQLAVTYLLQIIIIYIYSFISFESYQGRFLFVPVLTDNNNLSQPVYEEYCTNIIQCVTNLMNQGIVTANGIGSLMGLQSFSEPNRNYYYARFFSDVSFYMIVNVIFLNIIQGIIVDTFGQLRDKLTSKDEDEKNVCFICSQKKDSLISKGEAFQEHINIKHYTWNYVNFLVYIDEKYEKDCEGLEIKLKQMLQNEDSSWVPIVDENQKDEEQQTREQNKKYSEKMDQLDKILQQYENEYNKNL